MSCYCSLININPSGRVHINVCNKNRDCRGWKENLRKWEKRLFDKLKDLLLFLLLQGWYQSAETFVRSSCQSTTKNILEKNSSTRPTNIDVVASVRTFQNKTKQIILKWKYCSLPEVWLWVWPRGSLMTCLSCIFSRHLRCVWFSSSAGPQANAVYHPGVSPVLHVRRGLLGVLPHQARGGAGQNGHASHPISCSHQHL